MKKNPLTDKKIHFYILIWKIKNNGYIYILSTQYQSGAATYIAPVITGHLIIFPLPYAEHLNGYVDIFQLKTNQYKVKVT